MCVGWENPTQCRYGDLLNQVLSVIEAHTNVESPSGVVFYRVPLGFTLNDLINVRCHLAWLGYHTRVDQGPRVGVGYSRNRLWITYPKTLGEAISHTFWCLRFHYRRGVVLAYERGQDERSESDITEVD